MKLREMTAVVLTAACLVAPAAGAAEIEGVRFIDRLSFGSTELRLHGVGLLRYRVIFKGYVAALYLDDRRGGAMSSTDVLGDVPRRLEIEYFWAIPAKQLAKATVEGISRNNDRETVERLRSRIDQINALYEDTEPGDRYAITYLPTIGTELARNGRRLGVIEGAGFSSALFSIWLGDQPLDESLRSQLLAKR